MTKTAAHEPSQPTDQPSDLVAATNLWNRPAGIAEVLRVAIPLMISTGCLTLTLFADRTLLLWYGEREMAASMAAGNLFWSIICFPVGVASMTSALVAQYIGSGQPGRVGRLLWQAIWLAAAVTPLYLMLIPAAGLLFQSTGQTPELVRLETTYMQLLLFGSTGAIIESALSGFFSGTERTRTVMWVNISATILNLVLDVVLIFGLVGLPALGIAGAGIATTISFWAKAGSYFWLLRKPVLSGYRFQQDRSLDFSIIRRLLFFGVPAGLQYLTESGGFAVIVLQIGQVSTEALAATAMAINFNMAAFVPLLGVSIAASVLVGRHLVESGPQLASRAAISAAFIGTTYAAGWAIIYLTIPDTLFSLYKVGSGERDLEASIAIARMLMTFVAAYCLLDAVQLILAGALRGAGDTWFVLFASLSVIVFWLAAGLIGENHVQDVLLLWWWMLTGWIASLCVVMLFRFVTGGWTTKRMV